MGSGVARAVTNKDSILSTLLTEPSIGTCGRHATWRHCTALKRQAASVARRQNGRAQGDAYIYSCISSSEDSALYNPCRTCVQYSMLYGCIPYCYVVQAVYHVVCGCALAVQSLALPSQLSISAAAVQYHLSSFNVQGSSLLCTEVEYSCKPRAVFVSFCALLRVQDAHGDVPVMADASRLATSDMRFFRTLARFQFHTTHVHMVACSSWVRRLLCASATASCHCAIAHTNTRVPHK